MRKLGWFVRGVVVLAVAACGDNQGGLPGGRLPPDGGAIGGSDGGGAVDGTPITLHSDAPLVALQDGDGAWVALHGSAGVYQAHVIGPRYAVATACPAFSQTDYAYRTVSDPTEFNGLHCAEVALDLVTVTVTVTGADARALNLVMIGTQFGVIFANGSQTFRLPKGPADIFVSSQITNQPVRLYRGGPIDLEQTQTVTIDAALALPAVPYGLTLSDANVAPTDMVSADDDYVTATSHAGSSIDSVFTVFPDEPTFYTTLAESLRQPGDLTDVDVFVSRNDGAARTYQREMSQRMATPGDLVLALPPELALADPTLAAGVDPRVTWNIPTVPGTFAVVDYQAIAYTETPASVQINVFSMSASWAAGQPSLAITTPDLSGLPGWTTALALDATQPLKWGLERDDHDAGNSFTDGYHLASSQVCSPALPTFPSSAVRPLDLLRSTAAR